MKAKFIYETFKLDTDPIKDMKIGVSSINPNGEIDVWVRSSPRRDRKILDDLNLHFNRAIYSGGISSVGYRLITIYDSSATIEDVVKVLNPYIKIGVIKKDDIYYF